MKNRLTSGNSSFETRVVRNLETQWSDLNSFSAIRLSLLSSHSGLNVVVMGNSVVVVVGVFPKSVG